MKEKTDDYNKGPPPPNHHKNPWLYKLWNANYWWDDPKDKFNIRQNKHSQVDTSKILKTKEIASSLGIRGILPMHRWRGDMKVSVV